MATEINVPYEFKGFGAMDGNFPYEFIGFGSMDGKFAYEFIGFGAMFELNFQQGSQT